MAFLFKASKTVNNRTCGFPFFYNNVPQFFCVLNNSRFSCEVDKTNTLDGCNLGNQT